MKKFAFFLVLCALPKLAFAWGATAHKIIAFEGASLVSESILKNCQVSAKLLEEHTNDPDTTWKSQRRKFPRESQAHYFHITKQPADWKKKTSTQNYRDGYLVYRITDWFKQAKNLRKNQNWDELKEKLYGLTHYLGDLTQPLHLHHDYDGVEAGLPGLHSQFETKMILRFQNKIKSQVKNQLYTEKIPSLWNQLNFENLVFTTAEQSMLKAPSLFESAKSAYEPQKSRKRTTRAKKERFRFVKERLWNATGTLATHQMALGARLVARMLTEICQ